MSSPAVVYRELTFHFARAVSASQRPQTVQVVLTPLSTPTLAVPAAQTFVEGPVAREVVLSAATTTVVFRLVPSDLAGLSDRLLYRVAWRVGGVVGRTFTYDFAMPDADLSFEQLNSLDYVIDGQVYLQQADLGHPGRVAALNDAGEVVDAFGVPVAVASDITALENSLSAEVVARQSADTQLRSEFTGALNSQVNQVITTTGNTVNAARAEFTQQLAAEAVTRQTADAAQIAALAAKADLVAGKVPLNQIPDGARTQGVQVPNEAAMLALTTTQVQQFDFAIRPDGVFALLGTDPANLAHWAKLNKVSSVNGRDGDVVLTLTHVAAAGGTVPQNQVTGLATTLASKANVEAVSAVNDRVAVLENDATVVRTVDGVIPYTLNSTRMAYLDATGSFITRKDGTIISGAGGAVASVNGKVGNVVLGLTDIAQAGGAVPQSQVTGLVAALVDKISDSDARLVDARTPLAHAASHTATGSDPLTLTVAQITGLSSTLSTYNNRIGSLETRVTAVESGGGGGGGSGVAIGALTWFSGVAPTGDFTQVTLHSPFGYNPTNLNANASGFYYNPAGADSSDVRFPYITPNGHLELRKWDESGPADPVLATQTDLAALQAVVLTKADVATVNTLDDLVATKASNIALNTLNDTVNTKAAQSQLDALVLTVAAKASQSSVDAKADQTALDATNVIVSGHTTTLGLKADLTGGKVPVAQIPTAIPQANVTSLVADLAAKAPLVSGKVPVANIPTGIPQANIDGLVTTLATKADLVNGKLASSQIPALALTSTYVRTNRAAMLALIDVQPGDICVITATADQGSYILTGADPTVFGNWTLLSNPLSPVSSVNGQTGAVVLDAAAVGALASNASIPQSQVSNLTTTLAAKVDTSAYTPAIAARPTWSTAYPAGPTTVEAILTASAMAKQRVDYVSAAPASVTSLSGQQSVDGTIMPLGSLVLLTNQGTSVNNGIWQVNSGAWTRVTDMASGSYLVKGTLVAVRAGATNANTLWQCTSGGVVDTAASSWTKIGSVAATFTPVAGSGIEITGTNPTQSFAVKPAPTVTVGTGTTADPQVAQSQGISVSTAGVAVDTAIVVRKYIGSVPGGTTTPRIYHNLGTRRVLVQVQEATSGIGVLVGWQASGTNYVDLEFSTATQTGQWSVLVIG